MKYKIEFNKLKWVSPVKGVRHKYIDQNNLRIRLVEYTKDMPPHWCEKGHYGCVLEGRIEIEYENEKIIYKKGNGVFIPDGPKHRHTAKVLSKKVLMFLVENIE
jgi:quercetin dioxygenase-like cupin family protein